ncbi:hypothetical protein OP10G_4052 [Fimbriimonas ginsengisoli Gsoil 348]|uniref:Uncharacterized protein n=1 Tax=Fimbriimonas ginsengisoli Gsoil 348 TaxID=661478 RepID=A0A068NXB0_FIMGI|nr:hypothetical protein OP10G_4052 [Fimbriimonas ginsengisoli Gsoil 348]
MPSSDDGGLVELTPAGETAPIQAAVPPGVSIAAGESVAIIPSDTTLLEGLEGGADRNAGDITINGHFWKGVRVVKGRIRPAVVLPAGTYNVRLDGPFVVRQGANRLDVQAFVFHFRSDGHHISLPRKLKGQIPANGSNNWTNSITATFYPAFASGTANLHITHLNGTLNKTVALVGNTATFTDIQNDTQSHIPSQGVQVVEFTHL